MHIYFFNFIMFIPINFCHVKNIQYLDITASQISFNEVINEIDVVFITGDLNNCIMNNSNIQRRSKFLNEAFMIKILTIISDLYIHNDFPFKKYTNETLSSEYLLFANNKPVLLMNRTDNHYYFITLILNPSVNIKFVKSFGIQEIEIINNNNNMYYWNKGRSQYEEFSFDSISSYIWYSAIKNITNYDKEIIYKSFIKILIKKLPFLIRYCNCLLSDRVSSEIDIEIY